MLGACPAPGFSAGTQHLDPAPEHSNRTGHVAIRLEFLAEREADSLGQVEGEDSITPIECKKRFPRGWSTI